MCRYHRFRGVRGHAPSEIISYIVAAAFWDSFKAYFEENNLCLVAFAELKKYIPF